MFKKPSANDADFFKKNHLNKHSFPEKQEASPVNAIPIRRTDFRRIDPSLAPPITETLPTIPGEQIVLQGEELQEYIKKQKALQQKRAEAILEASETHVITDPEALQINADMEEQIIASAASALAKLPSQKRQLVITLINELKEN